MSIRTTVTLDEDVHKRTHDFSRKRGIPFRHALNELVPSISGLRLGDDGDVIEGDSSKRDNTVRERPITFQRGRHHPQSRQVTLEYRLSQIACSGRGFA